MRANPTKSSIVANHDRTETWTCQRSLNNRGSILIWVVNNRRYVMTGTCRRVSKEQLKREQWKFERCVLPLQPEGTLPEGAKE